ncbi:MAG: hypothetical protein PHW33_00270 [Candidatus Portnoybacteria bacterium]|jgi:hypothetical protein|nr:hypothetical protein [Candidatus Portnoybacteria bacterium]
MDRGLKEKIKNSGNNLHLDVAYWLEEEGWDVNLSPYYCDDITKKPREIDIIAKKTNLMVYDGDEKHKFDTCLFIECKNFKESFAFRIEENTLEKGESVLLSQNHNIFSDSDKSVLSRTNLPNVLHCFTEKRIARLWDSVSQEKDIFDAVTQPIKALNFFRKEFTRKSIFYPVVICRGITGFYNVEEVNPQEKEEYLDKLSEIPQITFGLNYASPGKISAGTELSPKARDFYIDFILEKNLINYLLDLKKESDEIGKFLLRKI